MILNTIEIYCCQPYEFIADQVYLIFIGSTWIGEIVDMIYKEGDVEKLEYSVIITEQGKSQK